MKKTVLLITIVILGVMLSACSSSEGGANWSKFYEGTGGTNLKELFEGKTSPNIFKVYYDKNSIVKSGNKISVYLKSLCTSRNSLDSIHLVEIDVLNKTLVSKSWQNITSDEQVINKFDEEYNSKMNIYNAALKKLEKDPEYIKMKNKKCRSYSACDEERSTYLFVNEPIKVIYAQPIAFARQILPDTLEYALLKKVQ